MPSLDTVPQNTENWSYDAALVQISNILKRLERKVLARGLRDVSIVVECLLEHANNFPRANLPHWLGQLDKIEMTDDSSAEAEAMNKLLLFTYRVGLECLVATGDRRKICLQTMELMCEYTRSQIDNKQLLDSLKTMHECNAEDTVFIRGIHLNQTE